MVKIKYFCFLMLLLTVFSCGANNKISFDDLFFEVKEEFNKQTFEGITQFGEVKKLDEIDDEKERASYIFNTDSLNIHIIRNEIIDTFSIYVQQANNNADDEIIKNKIRSLFKLTGDLKIEIYEKNNLTGECNFYFYLNDVTDLPKYDQVNNSQIKKYGVITYAFDKGKYINSESFKKNKPVELENNWYLYYF